MSFFNEVYEVCKKIPKGKVTTYGQIAFMIGRPRCSRQVGWALHGNPEPGVIPCHRVVNRFGGLSRSICFWRSKHSKRIIRSRKYRSV